MATLRKYVPMSTGGKYHEEQIKYWSKQIISETRSKHPEFNNLTDEELLKNEKIMQVLEDNPMAPKWKGSLASTYGVDKKLIQMDEWRNVCSGYTPGTDILKNAEKLNNNAFKISKEKTEDGGIEAKFVEKDGYRIGVEFLFTTSKEFSVLVNLAEGEQKRELLQIFNESIEEAMNKMEDMTYVRKKEKGQTFFEKSKGLLWAQFNHIENRGAEIQTSDEHGNQIKIEGKPQPNLHAHVVVSNTTKDKDGNNMSLSYDEITQNIAALNATFSMTLTEKMRNLGYEMKPMYQKDQENNEFMENTDKGVLTMVPVGGDKFDEAVDLFNARHKQIEKDSQGKGIVSKDMAQKQNRNLKTTKLNSELEQEWREQLNDYDPIFNTDYFTKLKGKNFNQTKEEIFENFTKENPEWEQKLIDSFYDHNKKIDATDGQIKSYLAMTLHQYTTKENAERLSVEIFEKNFSYYLPNDLGLNEDLKNKLKTNTLSTREREHVEFTTRSKLVVMSDRRVKEENEMVENFVKRSQETKFILNQDIVQKAIEITEKESGFPLSDEQRKAVLDSTTHKGAFAIVAGRAGSGKSTGYAKPVYLAYKMAGYEVIGLGSSSSNTEGLLNETGIEKGYNTEMFIKLYENGKIKINDKTVLIWDEAAMSDGNTWTRLTKIANDNGASIRFMGESEQLSAVGASTGFSIMEKLGFNTNKLTIINRQSKYWQKEATEQFASGKGDIALNTYHNEGKILTHTNKDMSEEDAKLSIGDRITFSSNSVLTGATKFPNTNVKEGNTAIVGAIDEKNNSMTLILEVKTTYKEKVKNKKGDVIFKNGKPYEEDRVKVDRLIKKVKLDQHLDCTVERGIADLQEANRIAVQNYMAYQEKNNKNEFKTKLIITDTNENASSINDNVREELRKNGIIKEDFVTIETKSFGERKLAIGDKITFKENTKFLADGSVLPTKSPKKSSFSVNNGHSCTIIDYNKKNNTMKIEFENGKIQEIRVDQKLEINHSYAITIHASQGKSIDMVYFIPTHPGDLSMMYVACSRQKGDMNIVLNDDLKKKLNTLLDITPPTPAMITFAQTIIEEKKLQIEPDDAMFDSFAKTRAFLNNYQRKDNEGKEYTNFNDPTPEDLNPMGVYKDFLTMVVKQNIKKTTFDYRALDDFEKDLLISTGKKFTEEEIKKLQESGFRKENLDAVKDRILKDTSTTIEQKIIQRDGGVKNVNEAVQIPTLMKAKEKIKEVKNNIIEMKDRIYNALVEKPKNNSIAKKSGRKL